MFILIDAEVKCANHKFARKTANLSTSKENTDSFMNIRSNTCSVRLYVKQLEIR